MTDRAPHQGAEAVALAEAAPAFPLSGPGAAK